MSAAMECEPPTVLTALHDSGLLLFAHGYTDGNGAKLAARLAEELRARNTFQQIAIAFSKASPTPDEALAAMTAARVFVAPLQIGATRVAARMLPEFLAKAPDPARVVTLDPLGCNAAMVELARDLIMETMEANNLDPATTSVLVAAQGSEHEDGAAEAARALVAGLRARGRFAEVAVVFQRHAPFANNWRETIQGRDIVALPFFISGGHHETKVMPAHLKKGGASLDGSEIDGRRVWLAKAVGQHPRLSSVILHQALNALEGEAP